MSKPSYRWTELLDPLKTSVVSSSLLLDAGKEMHRQIQARFLPRKRFKAELAGTFEHPDLPFSISYHVDLFDAENQVLFEIKPIFWYFTHQDYCEAQASGYYFFTKAADLIFLLYSVDNDHKLSSLAPWRPLTMMPWERVKELAIKGFNAKQKIVIESSQPRWQYSPHD